MAENPSDKIPTDPAPVRLTPGMQYRAQQLADLDEASIDAIAAEGKRRSANRREAAEAHRKAEEEAAKRPRTGPARRF